MLLPLLTNDTVLSNNREPSVNDFDLAGNRQAGQKKNCMQMKTHNHDIPTDLGLESVL